VARLLQGDDAAAQEAFDRLPGMPCHKPFLAALIAEAKRRRGTRGLPAGMPAHG
jgi:hypothetical protein